MEYRYLKEIVEAWESNPFFDKREIQGCSKDEIDALKLLVSPYMKRIPRVIEEELLYFGKYTPN